VTAQYQWDKLVRDPEGNNEGLLANVRTHRLAGEGRFFSRSGAFGRLRATYVDQSGRFQNALQIVEPGGDRFWTLDAAAGYRLPRQYGIAAIEVRNAFDREFRFQDISPEEPTIVPARQVMARFTVAF
jgi:hypothetical protein